jgi:hypothetical protein
MILSMARQISRRTIALGSFVLPWSTGSSFATAPMGDAELVALLHVCEEARKGVAPMADKSAIARTIADRDATIAHLIGPSGGLFLRWSAIATETRWTELNGLWYRMALDRETSLVTPIGTDDKLLKAALASLNSPIRISGGISTKGGLPIDMLARDPNAGAKVSLLAKITAIE